MEHSVALSRYYSAVEIGVVWEHSMPMADNLLSLEAYTLAKYGWTFYMDVKSYTPNTREIPLANCKFLFQSLNALVCLKLTARYIFKCGLNNAFSSVFVI